MKFNRNNRKRATGSAITFGVTLALILVSIGIVFFLISMFMGGQKETKNAVDAGMLNVGKKVMDEVRVKLLPTPNEAFLYGDVCNDDSSSYTYIPKKGWYEASLRRINRIWAKALLIAINAEAADREGHGGQGKSNAQQAYSGAQAISDRLAAEITDKSNVYPFFDDLARQNSVRMIGSDAAVRALKGDLWQTSFMDRGRESNVTCAPPEYTLPPGLTTADYPGLVMASTRKQLPDSGKNLWFLKGYSPIKAAGKTFWQIPFVYGQEPHLVSQRDFDPQTLKAAPIADWSIPIPNAFAGEGIAKGGSGATGKTAQKARSFVLSNPGKPFKAAMPHSFVKIKFDKMYSHWWFFPFSPAFDPVEHGDPQEYFFKKPEIQAGPKMPLGGAFCEYVQASGNVPMGMEVCWRTMDDVLYTNPGGGNATIDAYLLNRCNQMVGKVGKVVTRDELHDVLSNPLTIVYLMAFGDKEEYYLYTADGEKLEIAPKYWAYIRAPWIALLEFQSGGEPEGTEQTIVDGSDCIAGLTPNFPVSAKPLPKCVLVPVPFGWAKWKKSVYWTPGTGYTGCLGKLRVKRWTDVYSLGIAVPNPF